MQQKIIDAHKAVAARMKAGEFQKDFEYRIEGEGPTSGIVPKIVSLWSHEAGIMQMIAVDQHTYTIYIVTPKEVREISAIIDGDSPLG